MLPVLTQNSGKIFRFVTNPSFKIFRGWQLRTYAHMTSFLVSALCNIYWEGAKSRGKNELESKRPNY